MVMHSILFVLLNLEQLNSLFCYADDFEQNLCPIWIIDEA